MPAQQVLRIFFIAFPTVCVRRPIGFRSPPDQIPYAVRSDSVRRPIGFRPPSDRIPYGGGGIFLEFMHKINSGLSGFTCCVVIGLNGS